MLLYIFLNM